MFFDRDNNARRQRQIAYRNQLKNQVQLNNSKVLARPQRLERLPNSKPQTFSLLKNIEVQAQSRKNKQSQYYVELRNQIEKEKQEKKKKKQELARKQRQQQDKIRADNQMLRQRAEQQKRKQKHKSGQVDDQNNNFAQPLNQNKITKRSNLQQNNLAPRNDQIKSNFRAQNFNDNKNFQSRLKTSESNNEGQLPMQTYQSAEQNRKLSGSSYMPLYTNRVQNQSYNFLPKRKYMDSYFQELLGQRRRFQQQASQISELNKLFYQQKTRAGKIQSRGLSQLRKLQHLLDQKGSNYMANYSHSERDYQHESLRKLTIPSFQDSRMKQSGWRKLG